MPSQITEYVDRFSQIIVEGEAGSHLAAEHAAAKIVEGSQRRSRTDTGAMRGGWTMDRIHSGGYLVHNPVYYTIFNEKGTIYMSAQPMLQPSIEEVLPEFIGMVSAAW